MKTTIPHSAARLNTHQWAGLAKRMKAFVFDYILISGYIVLLAAAMLVTSKTAELLGLSLRWPENPLLADLLAFITVVLPIALYFTLSESSPKQATWGKRQVGIRVVNADGERLTCQQAFVRSLVKLLPWQIAHTCLFHIEGWPLAPTQPAPVVIAGFVVVYALIGSYVLSAHVSKTHRTPYDWVAGSYVVVAQ